MTKNVFTGIFSIVVGVVYVLMTTHLPKPPLGDRIGPRMFPFVLGAAIIVCGIILILLDVKAKKKNYINIDFRGNRELYTKIGTTIVFGIIYGLILETVGYLISSFAFVFAIMLFINEFERMWESLLVSLTFSILSYFIFFFVLDLSLPRGWLAF